MLLVHQARPSSMLSQVDTWKTRQKHGCVCKSSSWWEASSTLARHTRMRRRGEVAWPAREPHHQAAKGAWQLTMGPRCTHSPLDRAYFFWVPCKRVLLCAKSVNCWGEVDSVFQGRRFFPTSISTPSPTRSQNIPSLPYTKAARV